MWISVLKFNLYPKFLSEFDDLNESNSLGSITNSIVSNDPASVSIPSSKGGGGGYHYPNEECNGMVSSNAVDNMDIFKYLKSKPLIKSDW